MSAGLVPKNYNPANESAAKKFLEAFKVNGVKRVLILAVSPVKETSDNLNVILQKLELANWNFEFKICADLSCVNKLLGLGNHRSTFPCYICEWNLYECNGKTQGAAKRTFQSIKGSFWACF